MCRTGGRGDDTDAASNKSSHKIMCNRQLENVALDATAKQKCSAKDERKRSLGRGSEQE